MTKQNSRLSRQRAALLAGSAIALALTTAAHAQTAATAAQEVDQVVVTGTRLTGGFNSPTPVTVLGVEALQKRAPATIAEALNELPSFRASFTPSTQTRTVTGNAISPADLRGLGANRTLTLINGRRMTPANQGFVGDMGQIPTSLVERVDVVTGGASAAYGSDAVAGVVNFVLDNDFEGFRAGAQYGATQHGDQIETVLNAGYGAKIGDRFRFSIGGDFAKDQGSGSFYSREFWRNEPGLVGRISATSPAQSILPGVESILTPGGIITSGPLRGTAFTEAGAPYAFQFGTVVGNSQIGATSNYGFTPQLIWQMRHPFWRANGMLTASFQVNDRLELFTEINGAFNKSDGGYADTLQSIFTINSANPFIPASVRTQLAGRSIASFTLGRFNTDVSPYFSNQEYTTIRYLGGARGDFDAIGGKWDWEAYYQIGRTTVDAIYDRMLDMPNFLAAINVVSDANGNPVCGPVATNPNLNDVQRGQVEPGCVPFNVFGQTNGSAALNYVTGQIDSQQKVHQDVGGVSINGTPYALPAGDVAVSMGVEIRKETLTATNDPRSKLGAWQVLSQGEYSGSQDVKEGFIEVGIPVVKDVPFFNSLDLNAAIRRTDYSLTGAVSTWKVGGTWDVAEWLRLRATRSRDIRAPNLQELYTVGVLTGQSNIFNPFLQQNELRINFASDGNVNLRPEIANTFTAGVVFQPRWGMSRGLRASIDFFSIKVDDVTGTITAVNTINRCFGGDASLCSAITFDNAKHILQVRAPIQNLAGLEVEGYDFELSYQVPLTEMPIEIPGSLQIRTLGTVMTKNERTEGPVVVDRNGYAAGGTAKFVGTTTIDYTLDRFAAGLQAKYFDDVRYDPGLVGPDDSKYSPTLANSVSRNLFPGQAIFALNASYTVSDSGARSLKVYGAVDNLFDRKPNQAGAIQFNVGGVQYYDLMGRRFRIGARFNY